MKKIYLLANDVGGDTDVIETTKTKQVELTEILENLGICLSNGKQYNLILFNDDVNSMEHVTECLITICKISAEEAVKHMLEAHIKGKSIIKTGDYETLVEMKIALNNKKINASVEK